MGSMAAADALYEQEVARRTKKGYTVEDEFDQPEEDEEESGASETKDEGCVGVWTTRHCAVRFLTGALWLRPPAKKAKTAPAPLLAQPGTARMVAEGKGGKSKFYTCTVCPKGLVSRAPLTPLALFLRCQLSADGKTFSTSSWTEGKESAKQSTSVQVRGATQSVEAPPRLTNARSGEEQS